MLYLCASPVGVFVFDDKGNLVAKKLFSDPQTAGRKMLALESGEVVEEVEEILKNVKEPVATDIQIKHEKIIHSHIGNKFLRKKFRDIAKIKNLNEFICSALREYTKLKIKKSARYDKLLIHTVSAISDLDKILNLMSERLKEWYALYYPECKKEHRALAKAVKTGERENIESMGLELAEKDIKILREFAENLDGLYALREHLEKYLGSLAEEQVPNLNAFLGPMLSAKLVAAAGSLENLAKLTSSGIQLLGAEKAMFRFLKSKKKTLPPKHGLIAMHPDIVSAKKEHVGKVARLLASRLILAARADFYGRRDMSQELLEDYKKRLEKIKA